MRARLATLATLVCLALPTTVLTGCHAAIQVPRSDMEYCEIIADPPVKAGSVISAPAHYTCDGKGADTITMTVTLQRKSSNGTWKKLTAKTFVAHGVNTTRARTIGTRTHTVSAACANGQFRTLMHAVEKSQGHTETFDNHSVPVPNPCRTAF